MGVKHNFSSQVTSVGGPTYIQPTHWNDNHAYPPFKVWDFNPGVAVASFGMPSSGSATGIEFPSASPLLRGTFDFGFVDQLYLSAGVASAVQGASAALRFQYSPSGFPASWYAFDATGGSGPFVMVASANNASMYLLASNGPRLGATVAVSAAVKALPQPLRVRLAGFGGNGSAIGVGNVDVFGF